MARRNYTMIDYKTANLAGASHSYYVGDTFADLPISGMATGDLAFAKDTGLFYVATSPTVLNTITVTVSSHGASSHTDITRSFWMSPGAGGVTTIANLISTAGGPVYSFPNGSTETVTADFPVPGDWVSGMSYSVYWTPSSTATTSAVRWSATASSFAAGTDMSGAGTTAAFTGANAAKTVNVLVVEAAQALAAPTAGAVVRFALSRVGADGADTYSGNAQLVGVAFTYTANG